MYCGRLVTLFEWNQMYHLPVDGSFMLSEVFVETIHLEDG